MGLGNKINRDVYIVLHTLSIGGAERHASTIANFLSDSGYKVTIILLQDNRIEYKLLDDVKVAALTEMTFPDNVCKFEPGINNLFLLKIYKMFSKSKYQLLDKYLYFQSCFINKLSYYFEQQEDIEKSIVISFMTIPNLCVSVLKKQFGYKLVLGEFTAPQLEFEENAPENQLKRTYFTNADGFVFQTEEQESFYYYLKDVKKQVIPNPIEEIKIEPFHGRRKKEIVNYCKHVKAKNLPLLIEAFSKLSKEYLDYSLVIYGDGPERSETEKSIKEHGLDERVILKPYDVNVLEKVRESSMFVSSSDREGISNSMLEAMAIGLPTICTDCPAGGARMFINSYKNGILVPVKDPNALYHAMKYIIDNPDKAEVMSKNAVFIRDRLEKNKILKEWLVFIDSI